MPEYCFKHPKKEQYIDVVFRMNDKKFYIDENGVEWERQFSRPQVAIDSSFANVDPWDKKSFINKTNKPDTLGAIWDRSAELSEKRKGSGSVDPIKEQNLKDYGKTRKGAVHPELKKRESIAKIERAGFKITPD